MLKSGVFIKDFKSQNIIELKLNINDEMYFEIALEFPNIFPLKYTIF